MSYMARRSVQLLLSFCPPLLYGRPPTPPSSPLLPRREARDLVYLTSSISSRLWERYTVVLLSDKRWLCGPDPRAPRVQVSGSSVPGGGGCQLAGGTAGAGEVWGGGGGVHARQMALDNITHFAVERENLWKAVGQQAGDFESMGFGGGGGEWGAIFGFSGWRVGGGGGTLNIWRLGTAFQPLLEWGRGGEERQATDWSYSIPGQENRTSFFRLQTARISFLVKWKGRSFLEISLEDSSFHKASLSMKTFTSMT